MIGDYVALFGAGVASFLAPCVVPLVPAYLGIVVGESADSNDTGRVVTATAIFVLGFATVFAAFGVIAGLVGKSLDPVENAVQRIGGVVIIVFGLALLGVIRGPLARERRAITNLPSLRGPARPFVVGVAFGAAWSPCVGPLLGAALVVAAHSGRPVQGGLLLVSYALGIGVPFMIASLGLASSPALGDWMRRAGKRMERVAGVLLIVLGAMLATGLYTHVTSYLARFTPAVGGL
ncbi:MAG: cytochrome c biosis protein transrane region [Ilumatobacteraceae bacterium]|nr:cytochrome c biosis protein transrane region [Ilumatobacteraceae bacterium]